MTASSRRVNNRYKNFTHAKIGRRMAQIEESVAGYLHQRQRRSAGAITGAHDQDGARLKEKIAKLEGEMQRFHATEVRTPPPSMSGRGRVG
jgi:hypothetical protein